MPLHPQDYSDPIAPHAGEPPEPDTRQKILSAAAVVFMESGYKRATTRGIAAAAGVSEVTLFRHFESKENLMKAAMETYGVAHIERLIDGQLSGDYAEDIRMIGRAIMKMITERAGALCFAINEARHFPALRALFSQMPSRLWKMLAGYLQLKMDCGEVRMLHTEAAAQSFFGMYFAYAVSREAFKLGPQPELSDEEAADQIADIFVKGTITGGCDAGGRGTENT